MSISSVLKRTSLSIIAVFSIFHLNAQDVTLSGYIKDASNGETLIGATARIVESGKGVVSNEYGFYSISVPPGTYSVEYSYLGYIDQSIEIQLDQNKKQDIELGTEAAQLVEVVVVGEAEDSKVTDVEMSVNKLDIATIKSVPTLLGEVEVIRSLQLLPGVSTVGEGATGFNVRGGSIDQNLVLLDEAPVFNSSHLFGFFSVFNPDAIKDVKLYKGGIPSRYGGRLSSILDVRMKEGNSKNLAVNGGLGLIFSRLSVEAPISDKASFIVAGRRSYIDILAKPFLQDGLEDSALNFYDLTLKTNYKISEKDRIYLSGYFGRDNFGFGNAAGFNWGNSTGTLRWNHLFSDKLFSNFTTFYSQYDYAIQFGEDGTNRFDWNANITNFSVKPEFTYFLNPDNIIRFGGQSIYYTFDPGNAVGVSEGETNDFSLDNKYALESAIYVENDQSIGSDWKINYGLRWSIFNYLGAATAYYYGEGEIGRTKPLESSREFGDRENIATYHNFEPRLSIKYQLGARQSIKASYNRTTQYIHLISNTTASTPVDVWTPSTNNIEPQTADQVALGYFQNFNDNSYEFNAEVYYKKMNNLVDYIDGADLILNTLIEGDLLSGQGRAYGLELQLNKTKGRFTGWASYTLARTERQVVGINQDEWYPSRFDQTHNLSLTGFYELTDRWALSGTFAFISGTPTTFFTDRFTQGPYTFTHNGNDTRNNVRIPNYHRLDLSITRKGKQSPDKKWYGEWVFSVYNVYNRRNAFSIYSRQQTDRPVVGTPPDINTYRLSVIGSFIPSVSYNFNFGG